MTEPAAPPTAEPQPATSGQKGQLLMPIFTAVITGIFAAVGVLVGNYVDYRGKERELDIQMVEIGLSILRGETDGEKAQPAREFAVEALKQYSGLGAKEIDWQKWTEDGTVPFEAVTAASSNWSNTLARGQRWMLLDQLAAAQTDAERAAIIATLRDLEMYPNMSPNLNLPSKQSD